MRKRNRGGALLLVLLLTLGGAWPAYAAEPETPRLRPQKKAACLRRNRRNPRSLRP